MFRFLIVLGAVAALMASASVVAVAKPHETKTVYTARLVGEGNGSVIYEEWWPNTPSKLEQRLTVTVYGTTPDSRLLIIVNGKEVGYVVTTDAGDGSAVFTNPPRRIPSINVSSSIMVGKLSGKFVAGG